MENLKEDELVNIFGGEVVIAYINGKYVIILR